MAQTLVKIKGYILKSYYYEKGEHTSGYINVGFTPDPNEAQQFLQKPPDLDELHSRPNKFEEVTCYRGDDGKYYRIQLLSNGTK